MKKFVTGLVAAALLAHSLPALAGPHGRHDRHHYGPPAPRHFHHHHHHHRHGPGPLAWGLAGLALGSVIYTIAAPPTVVAPVVVLPPPRPPGRMAYFCESYQAYFPHVQRCPEGWRTLPVH
ncbi:MAG: hypothetical protein KGZ43_08530 [Sulfuritalea sp.]|nr:hypothetical protein [Sulfuritalea sp.]